MKAIQLIRVSTGRQDLDQQREEVMKRVISDGYPPENIISIEDVESAVKLSEEERQGLNKLKACIESDPEINAVYIYEISRLSRKPKVVYSIRDYLQEHHVQLYVLKPSLVAFDKEWNLNTDTNLQFSIFTSLAENEGYERSVRTRRGRVKAKSEGRFLGGNVLFGYDVDKKTKKMKINLREYEVIRFIIDQYLSGSHSQLTLCEELKKKGYKTKTGHDFIYSNICKVLKERNYLGNDMYPPIMTQEEWDKLSELRDKRQNKAKHNYNSIYFGKRKFFFTHEGKYYPMCVRKYIKSYQGWIDGKNKCNININLIDSLMWTFAKDIRIRTINDPDSIEEEKAQVMDKVDKLNVDKAISEDIIKTETERIDKIEERFIMGRLSEDKAEELEQRSKDMIKEEKMKINHFKSEIKQLLTYLNDLDNKVAGDVNKIEALTDDSLRKQIIDEEIERVIYKEKRGFCEYVIRIMLYHGICFDFYICRAKGLYKIYKLGHDKDNQEILKEYPVLIEKRFQFFQTKKRELKRLKNLITEDKKK